jgi:AcrR family transcriptional regulator
VGLREVKREKLRRAIIENAISFFRASGFEATRVREIAEACEISEATFFNYFPTKDAVLDAWVYERLDEAFAAAADGPVSSLRPKLRALAQRLSVQVENDFEFAACAWARARLPQLQAPAGAVALLRDAQHREELRRDLSPEELAGILLAVVAASISAWLAERKRDEPGRGARVEVALESRLRCALDLVLDGSRRRHERVRVGARGLQPSPGPNSS